MFRNIPTVTKNLLLVNILVFLAALILSQQGISLEQWGGLYYFKAEEFHVYQFVTYMFLHGGVRSVSFFITLSAVWEPVSARRLCSSSTMATCLCPASPSVRRVPSMPFCWPSE